MADLSARRVKTEVILPSRGYRYEGKIPEGKVEIAAVTAAIEERLAATASRGTGTDLLVAYVDLNTDFKSPDPSFSAKELQMGDCLFLAVQIRALTFGPVYEYTYTCPSCNTESKQDLNVHKQNVLVYSDSDIEPYEVELPQSKFKLRVRQPRIKDHDVVESFIRSQFKRGIAASEDMRNLLLMSQCVVSVDGNDKLDLYSKYVLLRDLILPDYVHLQNTIQDNECGYDFYFEITCPNCGNRQELFDLPIDLDFFRPGVSSRRNRRRQSTASVSVLLPNSNNNDGSGESQPAGTSGDTASVRGSQQG